jgi:hypothetical protein
MKRAIIFSLSLFSFFAVKAQLRPGDVSPTAKVIDADKLGHFNKGAAIITKGNLTALIDTAGNFIIPYGQYELSYGFNPDKDYMQDYETGFFIATKKTPDHLNPVFYINSKGKIIFDQKAFAQGGYKPKQSGFSYSYRLTRDCKFIEITTGYDKDPTYYIDSDGKRYQVSQPLVEQVENLTEGIGIVVGKNGQGYNYRTLENKIIPGGEFSTARPFYNGYAVVGKRDQFGNAKFGYINTKGDIVIPMQFSKEPSSFFGNAAKVFPQNSDEFEYAFINKSGEIIYKHTRENRQKYANNEFDAFFGNLCIPRRGSYILSVKGYLAPLEENIKGMKLDTVKNRNILRIEGFSYEHWQKNHRSNILVYSKDENVQSQRTTTSSYVDLSNGKVIDAPFVDRATALAPRYQLIFDSISQLAYARIFKSYKPSSRKWEFTEGYINRNGVFVIVVKKETSVW